MKGLVWRTWKEWDQIIIHLELQLLWVCDKGCRSSLLILAKMYKELQPKEVGITENETKEQKCWGKVSYFFVDTK